MSDSFLFNTNGISIFGIKCFSFLFSLRPFHSDDKYFMSYNLDAHGNTCPYAKCLLTVVLILTKTGMCQEVFLELLHIKNNENPLRRS